MFANLKHNGQGRVTRTQRSDQKSKQKFGQKSEQKFGQTQTLRLQRASQRTPQRVNANHTSQRAAYAAYQRQRQALAQGGLKAMHATQTHPKQWLEYAIYKAMNEAKATPICKICQGESIDYFWQRIVTQMKRINKSINDIDFNHCEALIDKFLDYQKGCPHNPNAWEITLEKPVQ